MITAGGIELRALLTPGHSPGSTCLYAPELGTVFGVEEQLGRIRR